MPEIKEALGNFDLEGTFAKVKDLVEKIIAIVKNFVEAMKNL